MFIITENFGEVPKGWMADVAPLFEGDMTCCTRKHQGGGPCDKESLVLPEAMLKARIVAGLNSVNVLQHPFLLMAAKHCLETPLKDLHGLLARATAKQGISRLPISGSRGLRLAQIRFSSMQ